jgi:type IV pilus assembly protein PilF
MRFINLALIVVFAVSCSSSNKHLQQSPAEKKADLLYQYGTEKLVHKDYTAALKFLSDAEQVNPDNSKLQNNLGMTYLFKKKSELAIKHLKLAISLDKYNSDARNNLASIFYQQKKFDSALTEYKEILKHLTYNRQYRTYYNMALIYNKKDKMDLVLEYLNKSIEEKNDYCPAHYKLGKYYYSNKRFNLALDHFHQSALGICFENPAPYFWKAKTLASQKRYFKAKQKFKELIKKFPKSGYSKNAYKEISNVMKQESLSLKMGEQNYRYKKNSNSLQSMQDQPVNLETPDF